MISIENYLKINQRRAKFNYAPVDPDDTESTKELGEQDGVEITNEPENIEDTDEPGTTKKLGAIKDQQEKKYEFFCLD